MDEIKVICKCGKEIDDSYNPPDNFEYVGCDEKNCPVFRCKDCGIYVYA